MAVVNQDQNNNNNQQDQQQDQPLTTGGGAAQGAPQGGSAPSSAQPQQRQGSGRFQNLSNYLNANQGAGQRMFGQIEQKTGKEFSRSKEQADTQAGQIRQAIQQSNEALQRGAGYQAQLSAKENFNPEQFVSDESRLQDFAKFKAGQNVDEAQLANQAAGFSQAAGKVLDVAQNRQQQAANEAGRFSLLKDTFSGRGQPRYSSGAQRLDQLLLQGSSPNVVDTFKKSLGQRTQLAQDIIGQSGETQNQTQQLAEQERLLASGLTDTSKGLESDFYKQLEGRIGDVNTQRQAEIEEARKQANILKSRGQVSDQFLQSVGLNRGQRTYGAFDQLQSLEQLAQLGPMAQTAQDVASTADAEKYNAIAKLAFGSAGDKGQFQMDEAQKRIKGASTLSPAVKALMVGDTAAANQLIQQGKESLLRSASGKNVGSGSYMNLGGSEFTGSTAVNLGDLIRGSGNVGTYSRQGFDERTKGEASYGFDLNKLLGKELDTKENLENVFNRMLAGETGKLTYRSGEGGGVGSGNPYWEATRQALSNTKSDALKQLEAMGYFTAT